MRTPVTIPLTLVFLFLRYHMILLAANVQASTHTRGSMPRRQFAYTLHHLHFIPTCHPRTNTIRLAASIDLV
ncbi:hypothetical protein BC827DRAFT_1238322 [Russula dissimulans]|nr:hypothetical protein BC827DRAFT_1238322 [Russula dissimulans]